VLAFAPVTVDFDARPYGPDSTPEEIAAMRARVSLLADDVVLYRELPVMTVFSVDVFFGRIEELFREHGCPYLMVDVSAGGRPDAAERKRIQEWIQRLTPPLRHIAVITAKNVLVTIAAKFVQATLPVTLSIHDTVAEAEEALRRVAR
jgi:hypothetical protein